MNSHIAPSAIITALLASLLTPGCFAVANLDRFEIDDVPCSATEAETRDYNYLVRDLTTPHRNQLFEMKVVEDATGRVAAVIVYDGVPDNMATPVQGTLTNALAPGTYKTRFWADLTMDRDFQRFVGGAGDHGWVEDVPPSGCFQFDHMAPFIGNVAPTDDRSRGNIRVSLIGLGDAIGDALIVRARLIPATGSEIEVGFYRLDPIPTTTTDARATLNLYDVAIVEKSYAITAFVDKNRNGSLDTGEPSFSPAAQAALPADALFELDLAAR